MSESKHTPGPWEVEAQDSYLNVVGGGRIVAEVHVHATPAHPPETADFEKRQANARLIAASPDLAETLGAVIEYDEADDVRRSDWDETVAKARAALDKAGLA